MQIAYRARLRANRLWYEMPGLSARMEADDTRRARRSAWPAGISPLDRRCPPEPTTPDQLRRRTFDLVGVERAIAPGEWEPADVTQLWRYHLNYFDWAWPLVDEPDGRALFGGLWCEWRWSTKHGRGDAWSPYVASLRAWVMCALYQPMVEGASWAPDFVGSIQRHAGYILRNLERDVGGNHLVKNIKALFGLGVFLGDRRLVRKARALLARELPVQVLADGGHFERSPSYHAQVLGDLIDICNLLEAAGEPPVKGLAEATDRMRTWLSHMLMPDDTVPLLRDCVPVSGERLDALEVERLTERPRMHVLADSGYIVVDTGRLHAVLDVGQPCLERLPAHAQADSLNWVLHVDGRPVVVDTGTSSYQDPDIRAWERSTAAHNTVEIDGQNSTEVFGAFRAGRRARVTLLDASDDGETVTVEAEHDGYRFLDGCPIHRRTWVIDSSSVQIADEIAGDGRHAAVARIHHVETERLRVQTTPVATTLMHSRADGMGSRASGPVLAAAAEAALPAVMFATLAFPSPATEGHLPHW